MRSLPSSDDRTQLFAIGWRHHSLANVFSTKLLYLIFKAGNPPSPQKSPKVFERGVLSPDLIGAIGNAWPAAGVFYTWLA